MYQVYPCLNKYGHYFETVLIYLSKEIIHEKLPVVHIDGNIIWAIIVITVGLKQST